jgi:DNA (cytosine-5)-methyltransferase 1
MAQWVGTRLRDPGDHDASADTPLESGSAWPTAAWGYAGTRYQTDLSQWPVRNRYRHLDAFVRRPTPLSLRATAGFLKRAETGRLRFVDGFLDDVRAHLERTAALDVA